MGRNKIKNGIKTGILRARTTDTMSVWIAAVLIPLFLIAPALWNGYPLLQWDTGGYLARWYEGYLVPSRSTVFGLYLHFGVDSDFWLNLGIQALATLWILQLCLRVLNLAQPFRLLRADRTGSDDGAGLGLSIVAAIAAAHRGTLDLQARPEGGLRVAIALPLAAQAARTGVLV